MYVKLHFIFLTDNSKAISSRLDSNKKSETSFMGCTLHDWLVFPSLLY